MTSTHSANGWIEFRARPSSGRVWTGALGIITLTLFVAPFIPAWDEVHVAVIAGFAFLGLVVSAPILAVAWYYPDMRYWIGPDELILRFGPLMNERIPLTAISDIQRRDLRLSPLASFRFPGLAIFDVDYREDGTIRMCATSSSKQILLIQAGKKRYGITPRDEQAFLNALRERCENASNTHVADEIESYPDQDCRTTG